jgi:ATP-binding cassette subfamily B (MDR/TAP) protein 1
LVFEALKRWHKNKTPIVIIHDLFQIDPKDFVYVLKNGMVIEQGFRYDLEAEPEYGNEGEEGGGEFREMVEAQRRTGGFLPEKSPLDPSPQDPTPEEKVHALLDADTDDDQFNLTVNMKHQSLVHPTLCPLTLSNSMFDVVVDLMSTKPLVPASAVVASREPNRLSWFVSIPTEAITGSIGDPVSKSYLPLQCPVRRSRCRLIQLP